MKKVISCVLLMLVLTSNALALEVPTDTVVQNLNGSQQAIKTFTVSPEQDPACLLYTSPSPRDRQKSRMPSSA